jgi:hypothetical protein
MTFEEYNFSVEFRFSTALSLDEGELYTTAMHGVIWLQDEQGNNLEEAGFIKVYVVDVDKMINEGCDLWDGFDMSYYPVSAYYAPLFVDDYDEAEEERNRPSPEEIQAEILRAYDRMEERKNAPGAEPEMPYEETGSDAEEGQEDDEPDEEYELGYFPGEFSKCVKEVIGEDSSFTSNVLIIDEIAIKPAFRRQELGLTTLSYIIYKLQRGCAAVAMLPVPMQHHHELEESVQTAYDLDAYGKDYNQAMQKLRQYWSLLGFKKMPNSSMLVLNPREFEVLRKKLWDDYPIQ